MKPTKLTVTLCAGALLFGTGACGTDTTTGGSDGGVSKSDKGAVGSTDGGGTGPQPDAGAGGPIGDKTCWPDLAAAKACGGSVAGTWAYAKGCVDPKRIDLSALKRVCAGASVSNVASSTSGQLTLAAGKWVRTGNVKVTGKLSVPGLCATPLGGCAAAGATISGLLVGTTASCTGTTTCACDLVQTVPTVGAGTYVQSGSTVTVTPNSGAPNKYYVCVKDRVLRYAGFSTNPTDNAVSYVLTPR